MNSIDVDIVDYNLSTSMICKVIVNYRFSNLTHLNAKSLWKWIGIDLTKTRNHYNSQWNLSPTEFYHKFFH